MFKKTKLAVATVALLGAFAMQNASAVALDDSGANAQVLIFPYYNTNGSFITAFNVRNIKNEYKVIKLRFRESKLSNDVLDFNVYMSPHDHFSVTLSVNAAGHASLTTSDNTCTYPSLKDSTSSTGFANVELKGNIYSNTSYNDAREGYLEVIEMGIIDNSTNGQAIKAGILHTSAGVPSNCGVIANAWTSNTFTQGGANALVGGVNQMTVAPALLLPPTGGIQGWSFLLDLSQGNANVAIPAVIRNYTTHAQHYLSSDPSYFLLPSLASGSDQTSTVTNNAGTGTVTTTWAAQADYAGTAAGQLEVALANGNSGPSTSGINPLPLAHVLAATAVSNDYVVTTTGDSGGTDWVITFPMRKHGVYSYVKYNPAVAATPPAATVTPVITDSEVQIDPSSTFYNREEASVTPSSDGFSPVATAPNLLGREVNILSFAYTGSTKATNVLGSLNSKPFSVAYGSGWGTLVLGTPYIPQNSITTAAEAGGTTPGTFNGVPVIGFAAVRGNFAAGAQNVIGESLPHTYSRTR